jgi:hypothetical protein
VAQKDSRVVVKMGEISRIEGSNMTTIAIVGLLFLPGTFVSVCASHRLFAFELPLNHVLQMPFSEVADT